jgi:hypothetical protein|eukprot:COSAG06_NODE_3588_length_5143_cov_82.618953_2_plen_168_part_00
MKFSGGGGASLGGGRESEWANLGSHRKAWAENPVYCTRPECEFMGGSYTQEDGGYCIKELDASKKGVCDGAKTARFAHFVDENVHFTKTGSGQTSEKPVFLSHLCIKMITLPRQARDRHRENPVFLSHLCIKMPSLYQDRLGTDIGKTPKRVAFSRRCNRRHSDIRR